MAFNSLAFACFLPVVFGSFVMLPKTWRATLLLVASLAFYAYAASPLLLGALLIVVLAAYGAGRFLGASPIEANRRIVFWLAVASITAMLALVKYDHVLFGGVVGLVGISYYSLQAIGYLVDVYSGLIEPETEPAMLALFLSYFPKLLQGPIERADDLIPQFRELRVPSYTVLKRGLLLIAFGLFKKLVIADRVRLYVDPVFADVHEQSSTMLLLSVYLYAFQIYFDFSGYTDIAIGTAKLFGIELTPNFNSPYLARSVAAFWRRWHISLSRWILDYLFRPLQFELRAWGVAGTALAVFVAFFVSGLWHGVGWTFVVWGVLHGLYLAIEVLLTRAKPKPQGAPSRAGDFIRWAITFHLVCVAWIFFRANTVSDAWYVLGHLGANVHYVGSALMSHGSTNLIALAGGFTCCALAALVRNAGDPLDWLAARPVWLRWSLYYCLALSVPLLAVPGHSQFIYLQF